MAELIAKCCTKCLLLKVAGDFNRSFRHSEGYRAECRTCQHQHYANSRETILKQRKQYAIQNAKRINEAGKRRYRKNAETLKEKRCVYKYGIAYSEYDRLYEAQEGKCAACLKPSPSRGANGLFVDHCHDTGIVRGLLCSNCNFAIGHAKDNPHILRLLASYLEKAGS